MQHRECSQAFTQTICARGWQCQVPAFYANLFPCLGHLAECLTQVHKHVTVMFPPLGYLFLVMVGRLRLKLPA